MLCQNGHARAPATGALAANLREKIPTQALCEAEGMEGGKKEKAVTLVML
jgi:hypothetical protein